MTLVMMRGEEEQMRQRLIDFMGGVVVTWGLLLVLSCARASSPAPATKAPYEPYGVVVDYRTLAGEVPCPAYVAVTMTDPQCGKAQVILEQLRDQGEE